MNKTQLKNIASAGLSFQEMDDVLGGAEDVFLISKNKSGTGILYNTPKRGSLKISVVTSKKHPKLALLNVAEEARDVENSAVITKGFHSFDESFLKKEGFNLDNFIKGDIIKYKDLGRFGLRKIADFDLTIVVPESVFIAKRAEVLTVSNGEYSAPTIEFKVTGISRVAEDTKTSFLVGIDEKKHFISQLRENVTSVGGALKSLRPKGLKSSAVRQGEWYFEPVSKALNKKLFHDISMAYMEEYLEPISSHLVTLLRCNYGSNDDSYALGEVLDERDGYHKPLILTGWHRVVRNNEEPNFGEENWD